MASKLVILNATPIENEQGTYFEIEVECRNDLDEPMQGQFEKLHGSLLGLIPHNTTTKWFFSDQGRRLQISAGFQNVRLDKVSLKSASKSSQAVRSSALFDVIETMEQHTTETPLFVLPVSVCSYSTVLNEKKMFCLQWIRYGFLPHHRSDGRPRNTWSTCCSIY